MGLVAGRFPNDGLRFPKVDEKPPFMTRQEIERQIAAGWLAEAQKKDLWNALFLTPDEVAELLAHLRESGTLPSLDPESGARGDRDSVRLSPLLWKQAFPLIAKPFVVAYNP
jgi:hypothetical protein